MKKAGFALRAFSVVTTPDCRNGTPKFQVYSPVPCLDMANARLALNVH